MKSLRPNKASPLFKQADDGGLQFMFLHRHRPSPKRKEKRTILRPTRDCLVPKLFAHTPLRDRANLLRPPLPVPYLARTISCWQFISYAHAFPYLQILILNGLSETRHQEETRRCGRRYELNLFFSLYTTSFTFAPITI